MAFSDTIGGGAGTLTKGQRTLANVGAGRIKPQVVEGLIYKHADVAPVYALTRKYGRKGTCGDVSFKHFETDSLPLHVEINNVAGYTDSDLSMALTSNHGRRVVAGTMLRVERTSEMIRVGAVSTDTISSLTRGAGGSTAAAILDDDRLAICGTAMADGGTAPDGISSEPTAVTNYCQIFKRAIELTGRDEHADVYGGKGELARLMKDANEAIMNEIELAYLFSTGGTATDPTITKGLDGHITTNLTNMAGVVLDEQSFNTFLQKVGRYNYGKSSKKSVLFAGTNVLEAIETFKRDSLRFTNSDEFLNLAVTGYGTSFAQVNIVRHGQLDDVLGSDKDHGRWGGRALYLNLDFVGRKVYNGRDMNLYKNVETPGTDGKKHYWMTDEGMWLASETRHGWIKGAASLSD